MDKKLIVAGKGIHGDESCTEERYDRSKKNPVDARLSIMTDEIAVEF